MEKVYKGPEKIRKILRYLLKQRDTKITIQEVKDFTTLFLEELIGSLMTYEITMKCHQEVKDKRKKNITLKASRLIKKKEDTEQEVND